MPTQTRIFTCQVCRGPIDAKVYGPWPDYCSGKCRARAYRRRKLGIPIDTPALTRDQGAYVRIHGQMPPERRW
jgi:hypothetical protein